MTHREKVKKFKPKFHGAQQKRFLLFEDQHWQLVGKTKDLSCSHMTFWFHISGTGEPNFTKCGKSAELIYLNWFAIFGKVPFTYSRDMKSKRGPQTENSANLSPEMERAPLKTYIWKKKGRPIKIRPLLRKLDPLKIFYGHIRNNFGFHSKYFPVTLDMILDSNQNILWSC